MKREQSTGAVNVGTGLEARYGAKYKPMINETWPQLNLEWIAGIPNKILGS
jgi:hypothetical protein